MASSNFICHWRTYILDVPAYTFNGDRMEHFNFNNETFFETIRKNIKRYRTQQGLTAAQLAEKAGLGHDYLRQIESEKDRHHVSLVSLYKISKALNVSIDTLIAENDDK